MKKNLFYLTIAILLFSCKKEEEIISTTSFEAEHGSIYVSNEGNFQSGNATLTYFNPLNKTILDDPFKQVNNQSLGDICQSMNIINGKLFIVVNNSGKIEVCDPYSLKKEFTISGLTSPRYIIPVNNSKAYVTDAYSNHVSIINLTNHSISGSITINGWTEQLLLKSNKIFVTNSSSDYLYTINPDTDLLNDSISISKGANSILEDHNGKLWILCGGDYLNTFNATLYRINPDNNQVENSFTFSTGEFPSRLCINSSRDSLYYLNNGVYKMGIEELSRPVTPFIASSGNNFYGLAVDKSKNEIYVSDAIDFIQKGKIFRYRADGSVIENFLAGIIPGDFIFLP